MLATTPFAAALLLAALRVVTAQTFTDCNPLDKTTCPSDPALATTLNTDFTAGASSDWSLAAGTKISYGANGAEFVISVDTDAPTVSSDKYIFFGKVDAVVRSAPGTGIVSSFILESDDLDEIDWEWLGSTDTSVESNFFGKGNTTTYDRAVYHPVADPIGTWHTYTVDWTSDYIKWSIDGNLLRTLNYGDALALEGRNFPQTPMKVKMGNWVGCANAAANQPSSPTYGTCQWAGGPADFSQAPFTMYVKSVSIQDYSCGSEYTYGDTSGSYQSIQISGACNGKAVSPSVGPAPASSVTSSISSSSGGVFAATESKGTTATTATTQTTATTPTTAAASTTPTTPTTLSTAASSQTTSSSEPETSSSSESKAPSASDSKTTSSSESTTTSSPGSAVTSSSGAAITSSSESKTTFSSISSTSTASGTSSSAALQVSANAASTMTPKSKYGALDFSVIAFGLTLGYFVM